MTAPDGVIDFNVASLGIALIERCRKTAEMDSIVPGAFADWGIEVGGKVFAIKIAVHRPNEVTA